MSFIVTQPNYDLRESLLYFLYVIFRVLNYDLGELKQNDGVESWRWAESKQLSELIQDRLQQIQHPKDCSKVKKLTCDLNKVMYTGNNKVM